MHHCRHCDLAPLPFPCPDMPSSHCTSLPHTAPISRRRFPAALGPGEGICAGQPNGGSWGRRPGLHAQPHRRAGSLLFSHEVNHAQQRFNPQLSNNVLTLLLIWFHHYHFVFWQQLQPYQPHFALAIASRAFLPPKPEFRLSADSSLRFRIPTPTKWVTRMPSTWPSSPSRLSATRVCTAFDTIRRPTGRADSGCRDGREHEDRRLRGP